MLVTNVPFVEDVRTLWPGNSLVNIELDREQIATKGFIAFLCSTMHIKQHTKSLPKLKHHKGSNYDAEEMIVHAKM